MTVTATRDDRTTLLPAAMSALLRRRGLQLLGIALIVLGLAALVMLATSASALPVSSCFSPAGAGAYCAMAGWNIVGSVS
jgi:hypothetical protein